KLWDKENGPKDKTPEFDWSKTQSVGAGESDAFSRAKDELFPGKRELSVAEIGQVSKRAKEMGAKPAQPAYQRPDPFATTEGANATIQNADMGEAPQTRRAGDTGYVRPQPFADTEGANETVKNDPALQEFYRRKGETAPTTNLTHYSNQEGLTETDPAKQGTGKRGTENKRANEPGYL